MSGNKFFFMKNILTHLSVQAGYLYLRQIIFNIQCACHRGRFVLISHAFEV